MHGIDVALRNAPGQAILNMGETSFTRALFEINVNVEPRYSASVLFAWSEYCSSVASFTDAIFRGNQGGNAALVNFRLRVTQTDVDNTANGNRIASTSDGRIAAFVESDGNITFAMGPNDEGKVHHVTLQDDLNGAVISTIDRIGGPPGTVANSQG